MMPRKVLIILVFFLCSIGAQAQSLPGMTPWFSNTVNETVVSIRLQENSINDGYALVEVSIEMSARQCGLSNMITLIVHEDDGTGPYGTERYTFYFEPGDGSTFLVDTVKTRILVNSSGSTEDLYVRAIISGINPADNFEFHSPNCTTNIDTQDIWYPSGTFATALDLGTQLGYTITQGIINNDADLFRFTLPESHRKMHAELQFRNDYRTDIANLGLKLSILNDTWSEFASSGSGTTSTEQVISETIDIILPAGTYYLKSEGLPTMNIHRNHYVLYTTVETTPEYTVSGQIMWGGTYPLEGVSLSGFPGTVTTDASGIYSAQVPHGWSGTISPSLIGYTFDPISRPLGNVTFDHPGYDFVAYPDDVGITGRVADAQDNGVAGVSLEGFPTDVVSDQNGDYAAPVYYGWSGTVSPTMEGLSFTPPNRSYANLNSDQVDQDYQASAAEHTVEGTITLSGSGTGLAGVSISGSPGPVITDSQGDYSFSLAHGTDLTITPVLDGYTFDPEEYVISNISGPHTADFEASLIKYNIYGHVWYPADIGLPGVQLTGLPGDPLTNEDGFYWAEVDPGWSGTVTPELAGYSFYPVYTEYTAISSDLQSEYLAAEVPFLSLSPEVISLAQESGSNQLVTVSSNVDWTVSCPADWLNMSPDEGSGNETFSVIANGENAGTVSRSATVTVQGGGLNRSVIVTQSALDQNLELESYTADLGAGAGSTWDIALTSNIDWTVSESAGWMSVSPSSGTGNAILTLTADSTNISFTTRTTSVTVSGEGITRNLEVTQLQIDPTLEITEPEDSLDAAAGSTITLIVRSNTSWTLSTGADWLSVWPDTARSNVYVFPTADSANTGSSARSTTLTAHGGGLTRSVTIVQLGAGETGIQDTYGGSILKLYPNPAGDRVFISGNSELLTECSIELHSITGQLLLIKEIGQLMPSDAHEVDLSAFPQGQYFVKIRSKQINQVLKLVKYK